MKIGLIGTGLMGKPMGLRLLENGFNLSVYNRTKQKTVTLAEKGARVFESPAELIDDTDTVILMLAHYEAIKEVLFSGEVGFAGKTIIQMSTISPEESKELKEKIEKAGGGYLEAPVLGSIPQAIKGELIIMVGSTIPQFKSFNNLFDVLGNKVLHAGEVPKAAALKLALNQLIITETAAFSMSLGYVRRTNVDVNIFMDILRGSALYAPTFDKKLERYLNRNFENPNFPVKHLLKDLNLISKDFYKNNINNLILEAEKPILQKAIEKGLGDKDYSAMYNIIHPGDGNE